MFAPALGWSSDLCARRAVRPDPGDDTHYRGGLRAGWWRRNASAIHLHHAGRRQEIGAQPAGRLRYGTSSVPDTANAVLPMVTMSPLRNSARPTREPLTKVPLRLFMSRISTPADVDTRIACTRDTNPSSKTMSLVLERPTVALTRGRTGRSVCVPGGGTANGVVLAAQSSVHVAVGIRSRAHSPYRAALISAMEPASSSMAVATLRNDCRCRDYPEPVGKVTVNAAPPWRASPTVTVP